MKGHGGEGAALKGPVAFDIPQTGAQPARRLGDGLIRPLAVRKLQRRKWFVFLPRFLQHRHLEGGSEGEWGSGGSRCSRRRVCKSWTEVGREGQSKERRCVVCVYVRMWWCSLLRDVIRNGNVEFREGPSIFELGERAEEVTQRGKREKKLSHPNRGWMWMEMV